MMSLNSRLLLASSLILTLSFGLIGFTLDKVFRNNAEVAVKDRLEGEVYTLIAATIIGEDKMVHLPDAVSFTSPSSEVYAQVSSNDATQLWRSIAMTEHNIVLRHALPPVTDNFERMVFRNDFSLFVYSLGVTWDQSENIHEGYTFSVAEPLDVYNQRVNDFRRNLWGWLGGVACVLLLVQGRILRWGLAPLRRAADDLTAIEMGQRTQLEGPYPRELTGLTDNLNALIRHEREHLERYRNTLGNLAHSLKTPLAVLQGEVENSNVEQRHMISTVKEQVERMTQIVEYQLQRAAASGRTALTTPVSVFTVASKIVRALNKVHAEKNVKCLINIDAETKFFGDEGDLLELLGNLSDNAFKWCRKSVLVNAASLHEDCHHRPGLVMTIEDDGPGIPSEQAYHLLRRGVRGDPNIQGHGIGLAVVQDILFMYMGTINIDKSSQLGGTKITVHFPGE